MRIVRYVAASLMLALAALRCGGDSSSGPTPLPTPTPTPTPVSVRTLVFQGSTKLERNFFLFSAPIAVQATSDLEFYVDWTFNDSNMLTFIASGSCNGDQFNNNQCAFIQTTEGTTPKPRATIGRRLATGTYTVLVLNAGPRSESISYQVFRVTPPNPVAGSIQQAVQAQAVPTMAISSLKR